MPPVELVARYSKTAQAHRDIGRALEAVEQPGPRSAEPGGQPRVHSLDRRLSPEFIATIVAEYESGTSSKQIQKHYGLGQGSVLRLLREAGVKVRNQGLLPEAIPDAIQRYQAGESLKTIGRRFGCDGEVVRQALAKAGIAIRPRPGFGS